MRWWCVILITQLIKPFEAVADPIAITCNYQKAEVRMTASAKRKGKKYYLNFRLEGDGIIELGGDQVVSASKSKRKISLTSLSMRLEALKPGTTSKNLTRGNVSILNPILRLALIFSGKQADFSNLSCKVTGSW